MERYIVMRILLGLFLLFAVIFFIVRLAGGGDDEPVIDETSSSEVQPVVLGEQNTIASEMQLTIRGRIVAPEDHRQLRFTISQNTRKIEIIEGYDNEVLDSMTLPNTANSYEQFLYALDAQGFTEERVEPTLTDPNGACSAGRQYIYTVEVYRVVRSELWSSSCAGGQGTFGGDRTDIVRLFQRQFPEYQSFTSGLNL